MKAQSSIDWFHEKTWELKMLLEKQQISIGEYGVAYYDIFQEAKEMHKEETIKLYYAYEDYVLREEGIIKTFGQFYNETYGGNNEQ